MLLDLWLDQPTPVILLVLAAGLAGSGAVFFLLGAHPRGRTFFGTLAGVAPPMLGVIGVLFSLLTGFLSSEVWEQQRQAVRAVQAERDSLLALTTLSVAAAPDMAEFRAALREYVLAVVEDEWPRMAEQQQSARTERALGTVLEIAARPQLSADAGSVTHGGLLTLALRLRGARSDRLSISAADYDGLKWLTVLMLAVLTQATIAVVHVEKRRAQATAGVLFTMSAIVVLGLLAVRERPFDGAHPVSNVPLREVLHVLPVPGQAPG